MPHDSLPGDLQDASHKEIVDALLRSSRHTAEWRVDMDDRVGRLEKAQQEMLAELRANTTETRAARQTIQDVSDALVTARTVRRLVVWSGGLVAAAYAIWNALSNIKLGGGNGL